MKLQKHILILTPGFPENEEDTTCIPALQAFVLCLHRLHGDQVRIQLVAYQYPVKPGAYTWHGISCWSSGGNNEKFPAKGKTWLRVLQYARRLHRTQKIDVVHSFWLTECMLTGAWISKFSGARHLAHIMGQDVLPENKYMRYFKPANTTIIANSPFTSAKLKESFHISSSKVIPFGLNLDDFAGLDLPQHRDIDILGVGSLTEIKNFHLFVDLFRQAALIKPGIRGLIIGDGPQRSELEMLIGKYGLRDSLRLPGSMERQKVLEIMAQSKILLHTSRFESAGYVFLEALYSGMKVVAFETGFLPKVPGAFSCSGNKDVINKLEFLLSEPQSYVRAEVPSIVDTVRTVSVLYGINNQKK